MLWIIVKVAWLATLEMTIVHRIEDKHTKMELK
jgi:hypothetical protein